MCLINFDFDGRCYAIFIGSCYALAEIAIYVVLDGIPQRKMLLPLFIQVADVIAILLCGRWYATRLHVTALEGGRCYCQGADGITTFLHYLKMANVIAKWQME